MWCLQFKYISDQLPEGISLPKSCYKMSSFSKWKMRVLLELRGIRVKNIGSITKKASDVFREYYNTNSKL